MEENKNVYFGLTLPGSLINEENIQICKKLFLVPSFDAKSAGVVLSGLDATGHISESMRNALDTLMQTAHQLPNGEAEKKLKNWLAHFPETTEADIKIYQNFHNISGKDINEVTEKFNRKKYASPSAIKKYLDEHVVGQEDAKKILSVSFYLHLLRIKKVIPSIHDVKHAPVLLPELPKPNVLLAGPTGSGKTFMIKLLCDLFGLPYVKIDCSSLTSSGYVGGSVHGYLQNLIRQHGHEKAEKAIIYFDEFDKISEIHTHKESVGGVELQQEFLTLLEDKEIYIHKRSSDDPELTLNSRNLMFIFSGSFAGAEKIISKRLGRGNRIGFSAHAEPEKGNLMKSLNYDDMMQFGIIPELTGRINFIAVLDELTKEDLVTIIKTAKNNILAQFGNFFTYHFDTLIIEEDVFGLIAEEALRRKLGARALLSVIMHLLGDLLYDAVDNKEDLLIIDKKYFLRKFNNDRLC